jgi:hypothetical protein
MRRQLSENRRSRLAICLVALCLALALLSTVSAQAPSSAPAQSATPRGQKLFLKDGTYQLVREYRIDGDRVSYYSLDTHQWEEMPGALVDWDATKKEAAQEQSRDAALANSIAEREQQEHAEVLAVDASIEPAPGVFLPPDPGLFAFDGKGIQAVAQADMQSSLSKGKMVEKVLVPIPIVPTRHNISIMGTRSKLRIVAGQPEFYLRIAKGAEPEMDLVRAKIHGNERQVENVDEIFGETAQQRKTLELQRWDIAPNVYRYTLATPLQRGEYVLVETLPGDQLNMYLWDFGVDVPAAAPGR